MSALLSLLKSIQQHSLQLLDCLKQEKLALDSNELQQLSEISSQKQSLVDQLQTLDQQRSTHCSDNNFNQFITDSHDQALIVQWKTTRDAIQSCQQQNEVNGRILNKRNRINQEALSIITGRHHQGSQTYDAQGNQGSDNSLLNGIEA